eukprot:m.20385 g.20385  ORF g.20385 m.20385 type:complete len:101 (+) comp28009_c0_seq1:177-479(+)
MPSPTARMKNDFQKLSEQFGDLNDPNARWCFYFNYTYNHSTSLQPEAKSNQFASSKWKLTATNSTLLGFKAPFAVVIPIDDHKHGLVNVTARIYITDSKC